VVLAPPDDKSRLRDASRGGIPFYEEYPEFENGLSDKFGGAGLWVDSGPLTLQDTVAVILENLDNALFDAHEFRGRGATRRW